MLNKLKQLYAFVSMPVVAMIAALLVLCLVVMKILTTIITKSQRNKMSALGGKYRDGGAKIGKKKKSKKLRPTDILNSQKSTECRNNVNHNNKVTTPTLENGDMQSTKKLEKKKGKSKKKKTQISPIPAIENCSLLDEEGEWQTVNKKEQRSLKREKKRQDSSELLTPPSSKPVISLYAPMPSIAKDIAPRFAHAAGVEWQEGASKRRTNNSPKIPQTVVNRTPMVSKILEPDEWMPSSDITTSALLETKKTSDIMNNFSSNQSVPSWNPMGGSTDPIPWSSTTQDWPLKPSTNPVQSWISPGASVPAVDLSHWKNEVTPEEWVHVTTPSPTRPSAAEGWVNTTPVYQQSLRHQWADMPTTIGMPASDLAQSSIYREKFVMEPEGYSVTATVEVDDPWNTASCAKDDDWSPPDSSWSNINEEWKAPVIPVKQQPTYFEESTDDEKANVAISTTSGSIQQVVVGAGSDMLASTNQSASKKPRRRRRKKQIDIVVTADVVKDEVAEDDSADNQEVLVPPSTGVETNVTEWTTAAKKKARPRKAE